MFLFLASGNRLIPAITEAGEKGDSEEETEVEIHVIVQDKDAEEKEAAKENILVKQEDSHAQKELEEKEESRAGLSDTTEGEYTADDEEDFTDEEEGTGNMKLKALAGKATVFKSTQSLDC